MSPSKKEKLKNGCKQLFSPDGYSDRLRLPPGCGGPSQIILTGKEMVTVDGCEGLVNYQPDHVTLILTDHTVTVYGCHLTLKTFSCHQLAICGKIFGVLEGTYNREAADANR